MSLGAQAKPFEPFTIWRTDMGDDGKLVVFLHVSGLALMMSPEELGRLTAVLLHAIEDTPVLVPE